MEHKYIELTLKLIRGNEVRSITKILEKTISYALRAKSGEVGDAAGLKHMKSFSAQIVARVNRRKDGMKAFYAQGKCKSDMV